MRALLVVLALCGLALSGCLGGVGTITAKDGLSDARDAAKALAGGSVELMGVASLEPFSELHDEDDDAHIYLHLDKTPGDGVAPGWFYEFRSGDDAIAIAYASGLGVLAEIIDGGAYANSDAEPISSWKIDSDDAAKALARHDDWPEVADDTAMIWALMQMGECPVWGVERIDLEQDRWISAAVDGCTGEVLHMDNGFETFALSCQMMFDGQALITTLQDFTRVVSVDEGGSLGIDYQVEGMVNDFTVEIRDPNGNTMTSGTGATLIGTNMGSQSVEGVPAGDYTIFASTSGAALSFDYTATVCA